MCGRPRYGANPLGQDGAAAVLDVDSSGSMKIEFLEASVLELEWASHEQCGDEEGRVG